MCKFLWYTNTHTKLRVFTQQVIYVGTVKGRHWHKDLQRTVTVLLKIQSMPTSKHTNASNEVHAYFNATNTQERWCVSSETLSIPLMTVEYLAHAWYHIDWAFHLHLDTHSDYNSPQSGQYVNRTINDPAPEKQSKCLTFCRTLQWWIIKTSLLASVQQG